VIGRWRRRRQHDLRRRLVLDVMRTQGLMVATLTDARRIGAPVSLGVAASAFIWSTWATDLADWVKENGS
jgi:hypothetical protein